MKRIIFILFLLIGFMHAKGQSDFNGALAAGDSLMKMKTPLYESALNQYFAAEAFDPSKKNIIKSRIDTLFKKIDSLKTDALNQKIWADTLAARAKRSDASAQSEKQNALESASEARVSDSLAQIQIRISDSLRKIAETAVRRSDSLKTIAENALKAANQEKNKVVSRNMANESIMLLSENNIESDSLASIKVTKAYNLNDSSGGPAHNKDIYNALNLLSLTKSIGYKNQWKIHDIPVRCITGIPGTNTIFSGDEDGWIKKSSIADSSILLGTKKIKGQIRALRIVPDNSKIVAITENGKGRIVDTSLTNLDLKIFTFNGIGKAIQFKGNEDFVVLSSEGLSKHPLIFPERKETIQRKGIQAFTIDKTGKFYLSSGKDIMVYATWEDVRNNYNIKIFPVKDSITSLSIFMDDSVQYIAAGTENGKVWIRDLSSENAELTKTLHISQINDLKFSIVDSKLQLAAAGADQKIILIDVDDFLGNNKEDELTLSGHTKWVYSIYYTTVRGYTWLYSSGEDNKIIKWYPSMKVLYNKVQEKDSNNNKRP